MKTAVRKQASRKSATRPTTGRKAQAEKDTPRQRLIASATQLFCKNGINATGVDAIIAGAGTAKTTLYKEFGSKEKLVHIVLETEGMQWREWFIDAVERGGGDAGTRLMRVFTALKQWFQEDSFFGCPFINAIGEHDKSDKALRTITLKHKRVVLAYLETLAREIGAPEPEDFAHQIALLMDGAIVAAMVTGNARMADTAAHAARCLIDKLPAPARGGRRHQAARKLEAA
jgi:AcrR family transcriptional regulator